MEELDSIDLTIFDEESQDGILKTFFMLFIDILCICKKKMIKKLYYKSNKNEKSKFYYK